MIAASRGNTTRYLEFKLYTFEEITNRFFEIVDDVIVFNHLMNVLCISFNTKLIF